MVDNHELAGIKKTVDLFLVSDLTYHNNKRM